jgi:EAL domain-containing protein (putative c-di-GMP-specific phosphodiesterase class I)
MPDHPCLRRRSVATEGIETEAQLKRLRDLGCDLGQGFYLGRPMPAEDTEIKFLYDQEK